MDIKFLNLREVRNRVPRSRSTIYAEITRSLFPRPIKIGRGSYWREDEINSLLAAYTAGAAADEVRGLCQRIHAEREAR